MDGSITEFSAAPQLDGRERHFRIPGPRDGLSLFLRFLPAEQTRFQPRRAVLYVHGATFPSALSIAHRFDGKSWRDALCEAGFDVWELDFYGFGHSDRYPEMGQPTAGNPALCVAADAAGQLEAAIRFVLAHQNIEKLSLISHSWGSMPAGLFAGFLSGMADRDCAGSMEPVCRGRPRARAAGSVADSFRGMGGALSRQRPGEPLARSRGRQDPARSVQRDHQGVARPSGL